ncbi:MAG: hypothetical protein HOO88_05030 [Kiritimatiellaceae bacterium]|nr:hypothetical protein [Kiritimatiellaceae bacterium]
MYYLLSKISMIVWYVIWLGVPGLVLTGVIPATRRMSGKARFFVSVIAVWVLLILYHFFIHDPILLKVAQLENQPDPETGAFLAKFFMVLLGWIVGIQSTLAWIFCIWLYKKWRSKKFQQFARDDSK